MEKYKDTDLSKYTIIESDSEVSLFSCEVNVMERDSIKLPTLNFSSLNMCIEEELSNRYQPIELHEEGE